MTMASSLSLAANTDQWIRPRVRRQAEERSNNKYSSMISKRTVILAILFGIIQLHQSTRIISFYDETKQASTTSIVKENIESFKSSSRKRYRIGKRRNITSIKLSTSFQKKAGSIVDILSIGSNTRPDYYRAQRNTWANHPLVRNFFVATETHDDHDPQCLNNTERLLHQFSHFCKDRYMTFSPIANEAASDGKINLTTAKSWLMNRYVHRLASPHFMKKKSDPVGWLCAQTRFPLAISKIMLGYEAQREELPDYLLLVDDDTYYNMDHYQVAVIEGRNSSTPYVAAACRSRMPEREYTTFPIGGFGMTISKGSIERFLRPISKKSPTSSSTDSWENSVLGFMKENLLLEEPTFRDGMSLIQLMDTFTREEKISEIDKWTRGFCFHGDWIVAIFVMVYNIGGLGPIVDTIYDSEAIRKQRRGICRNDGHECWPNSLACHYQTPEDMERLSNQAAQDKLDGNWTGIQKERERDQWNYTIKV